MSVNNDDGIETEADFRLWCVYAFLFGARPLFYALVVLFLEYVYSALTSSSSSDDHPALPSQLQCVNTSLRRQPTQRGQPLPLACPRSASDAGAPPLSMSNLVASTLGRSMLPGASAHHSALTIGEPRRLHCLRLPQLVHQIASPPCPSQHRPHQ